MNFCYKNNNRRFISAGFFHNFGGPVGHFVLNVKSPLLWTTPPVLSARRYTRDFVVLSTSGRNDTGQRRSTSRLNPKTRHRGANHEKGRVSGDGHRQQQDLPSATLIGNPRRCPTVQDTRDATFQEHSLARLVVASPAMTRCRGRLYPPFRGPPKTQR